MQNNCKTGHRILSYFATHKRTSQVRGGGALREGAQELWAVRAVPDRVRDGLGLQRGEGKNKMSRRFPLKSRISENREEGEIRRKRENTKRQNLVRYLTSPTPYKL